MQLVKQTILAILILFFGQSVHSAQFDSKTYIDAEEIKAAHGKYPMNIKGVGSVHIQSVSTGQGGSTIESTKSCLIERAALEQEITRAFKSAGDDGTHKGETREVKMKGEEKDGQMVCSSGGTNFTVIVVVWDPDDPRLPE